MFSSTTVPSKSHYWSFGVEDRCWRIFTFAMDWMEFMEDEIGIISTNDAFEGIFIR
eukprot:TRINITY_DN12642_c0_g1_i1.p2 TRINITY_DN12642_c0_g1~~TRINITY_DN12642_c0_g1_i1.p2  ORF type:complete len:56 (-),score=13.45 TRINITY_DN12642_c0_g1_i1:21-188(-)